MIKVVSNIAEAYDGGRVHLQNFIKIIPSTYNIAKAWWDMTMAGSFPRASYYQGDDYRFTTYPSENHLSIYHGGNVSPYQKIIRNVGVHVSGANLSPSRYILCDFLGFYTGISWETSETQILNNTTTLPRYVNGEGVRAFIVQLFGNNANSVFTINYTNTKNEDVNSPQQRGNALGTGGLQHNQTATNYSPFIDLANRDSGIKRVNSITVTSLGAGIAVLVLVKPIVEFSYNNSTLNSMSEKDFLTNSYIAPVIEDGAKLNLLFTSNGSPTGLLVRGYCEFIWS